MTTVCGSKFPEDNSVITTPRGSLLKGGVVGTPLFTGNSCSVRTYMYNRDTATSLVNRNTDGWVHVAGTLGRDTAAKLSQLHVAHVHVCTCECV